MHISRISELEKAVKTKVKLGPYNNAKEVIREAFRQSHQRKSENQWLKREATIGDAQLESGETVGVESKSNYMAMVHSAP